MSPAPDTDRSDGRRCTTCTAPLAHDQRYCVRCGTRRGPLPTRVAVALGELAAHARPTVAAPPTVADTPANGPTDPAPDRRRELIPFARAAAVSILLMLGVGSVIGAATTPGGVTSLARTVVLAFSPAAAPPPPATTVAATHGTGGGGSGGGRAGGGGGTSGGGSGAAPATQTTRTVTAAQPTSTGGSGGGERTTSTTSTTTSASTLPPIGHVWEIVLSDEGYAQSFGDPRADPYLARTLAAQGELISNYDAVATSPLANEIALISGQGPTPQTVADCPQYADVTPGSSGKLGQVLGAGCLYPATTDTLGLQLQVAGLSWRAYVQGIGDPGQAHPPTTTTTTTTTTPTVPTVTAAPTVPTTSTTTTSTSTSGSGTTTTVADTATAAGCPHPAEGATDPNPVASPHDGYVTWKNPWVYFHSVVDRSSCRDDDVGLTRLATDLTRERTTPSFSYIAPDPCDDGSVTPCDPGAKAGLAQADAFLKTVVPEIERSPAYRDNGLILITFDEAPQSGPDWSTASCCGQPTFPNLRGTASTTTSTTSTSTTSTAATTPTTTVTTTATVPATTTTSTTSSCPTSTSTTTTTTTPTTPTDCQPAIAGDPPGGGQVGLLMISPYVKPGVLDTVDVLNHFSLLKSVEKLFGVSALGDAGAPQVPSFSPSLFEPDTR